jgi:hypothetical protein
LIAKALPVNALHSEGIVEGELSHLGSGHDSRF